MRQPYLRVRAGARVSLRGRVEASMDECESGGLLMLVVGSNPFDQKLADTQGEFTFRMRIKRNVRIRIDLEARTVSGAPVLAEHLLSGRSISLEEHPGEVVTDRSPMRPGRWREL